MKGKRVEYAQIYIYIYIYNWGMDVIVGALERGHEHIYVYSSHIPTCVKDCVY